MNLEQALLRDIREDPEDDTPRLVLADWLMEQPEPERAARGEFIRLQCLLAGGAEARRAEDQARAEGLLARHGRAWLGPLGDRVSWVFRRGLLHVSASKVPPPPEVAA